MILLVDIGTTRIKWSTASGSGIAPSKAAVHRADPKSAIMAAWSQFAVPSAVLISSVAGEAFNDLIVDWCRERWELTPQFVTPAGSALGVTNGYENPEALGSDRWMALIAVQHLGDGPACIVDCGTAVTIDGLGRSGRHLGGMILPGLGLMRDSLHLATAHLPRTEGGHFDLLASDTASAIRSGTGLGLAAAVDGLVAAVEASQSEPMRRFLTGGDAALLASHMREGYQIRLDLVIEGLAVVAGITQ